MSEEEPGPEDPDPVAADDRSGGGAGADAGTSTDAGAGTDDRAARRRRLDERERELERREQEVLERREETVERTEALDERETRLDDRESRLDERERELRDRAAELDDRAAALDDRETEIDAKRAVLQEYFEQGGADAATRKPRVVAALLLWTAAVAGAVLTALTVLYASDPAPPLLSAPLLSDLGRLAATGVLGVATLVELVGGLTTYYGRSWYFSVFAAVVAVVVLPPVGLTAAVMITVGESGFD